MNPRLHTSLLLLALICASVLAAVAADPPSLPEAGWVPNGQVNAIVRTADIVYLGGAFTALGRNYPYGVPLDTTSGLPVAAYPKVYGSVSCCAPDGAGGWYIGGDFTQVGALTRSRLAHIKSDGTVDTAWNPKADNSVYALAVSGSTVYAGGMFTTITIGSVATTCRYLAAIGTDGTLAAWNPNANNQVVALAVSGATVYVGGTFTTIGGTTRNYLAAIGTAGTGTLGAWDPNANGRVNALAVSGSTVYAGGAFTTIGGTTRNRLAAISTDGTLAAWNPNANGTVQALEAYGVTIYVGGSFTTIGGTTRNRLAAVGTDGALAAWNPNANNPIYALAASDGTVYVGGNFTTITNGSVATARNRLPAIGMDGTLAVWDPNANNQVYALAVSGATVYVGGNFTTITNGSVATARNRLAAVGTDGALAAWNPNANNQVYALAVPSYGSPVCAGGVFTTIGGSPCGYFAQFGSSTIAPTTTELDSSANPSSYGASVTFTAAVSPSAASGTVTFKEGGTTLGPGTLVLLRQECVTEIWLGR